jgi:hypothetical protein
MPAIERGPGASLGKGWVAMTVRVPTGAAVRITDLFADPSHGLRVLATAWKAQMRQTKLWGCIAKDLIRYRPTAQNYRYFALTPNGVAVRSWQEERCNRTQATVPYTLLRPYLSSLGKQLVVGVRRPR